MYELNLIWVENFPLKNNIKIGEIYITGTYENPACALFRCPRRFDEIRQCDRLIYLPLLQTMLYNEKWILTTNSDTFSLTPSISMKNCDCHFWIRNKQIIDT